MIKKQYISTAIVSIFLCICSFSSYAQKPADAVAEVPELDSFHEVIFKIWHEAWPNKDTAMLKDLQPSVEEGIANVAAAQLPGILREKKTAWVEGIEKLKNAGAEYKAVENWDASGRGASNYGQTSRFCSRAETSQAFILLALSNHIQRSNQLGFEWQ